MRSLPLLQLGRFATPALRQGVCRGSGPAVLSLIEVRHATLRFKVFGERRSICGSANSKVDGAVLGVTFYTGVCGVKEAE